MNKDKETTKTQDASARRKATWEFESFYSKLLEEKWEEMKKAFKDKKPYGSDEAESDSDIQSALSLQNEIDFIDTRYQWLRRALFPEIHAYIREHGIPDSFPTYDHFDITIESADFYRHFDDAAYCVKFPFYFMGFDFLASLYKDGAFLHVPADDADGEKTECILRPKLREDIYYPDVKYYDPEYQSLEEKVLKMYHAVDGVEEKIKEAKEDLKRCQGNLFTGILGIPFKIVALILESALPILFPAIGMVVVLFVLKYLMGKKLAATILGVIVVIILVIWFGYNVYEKNFDIDVFGCFTDFRVRRESKKTIREAEAEHERITNERKKSVDEVWSSEAYKKAYKREQSLKNADHELAKQWQTAWADCIRKEKADIFFLD